MNQASLGLQANSQRILALSFPHLSTDRIARRRWGPSWRSNGRPEASPIVCSGKLNNAMRLTALDELAETLGLRKEQGVAEARAMYPALDVVDEDIAADRRLLEAIADWCDRYTPLVALDGKEGLFLDITGCAHLFGGEKALLKDILSRLFHMGLDAQGAISSSPGLSWAMSRFGQGGVVEDEETERVLMPLPIAALRLEGQTADALKKLGLKYIGDVIHAPRAPLTRRFGPELLLRLDQALGHEEEPVSPRRPIASLSSERRLVEPIGTEEQVLAITSQIAVSLKPSLEARGAGGRVFELVLFRVDGRVFRIAVGASRPLREPRLIAGLFSERLQVIYDDIDAGYGFDILRLNVLRHDPFDEAQADFEGDRQGEVSLSAFIDRVSARLGADCLQSFQLRESHVPERAVITVPAIDSLSRRRKTEQGSSLPFREERPLRLFATPEPVETVLAEVPDGPPQIFRWRRMQHQLAKSEGPERIAMEWWIDGSDAEARDYFRIEDEAGHRYWIYRRGFYGQEVDPRWFMHGVFA
ncbi:DNA polymerase Y family protein [Rhizobium lentis]|uniref:DNA polymerase Y family protein n=1 Tax=Rhizobium lentis TaxID=1138194 RepID=A0A9Q3QYI5_9HYPH|nr:DNA polymerase Y family protein [Rhizobium lentis]MBX4976738.1 DNA polymerase Y family protein [Rhizobium lentis]MBX4988565.1 DNA polymerase Y family protein [Rhizobium lentis]MBX5007014.1 DNA polymerase Y family protein [Rhizobium lentis]MBX5025939.1 DNA polymerase Y family protein [Rhizobium lentis]